MTFTQIVINGACGVMIVSVFLLVLSLGYVCVAEIFDMICEMIL